MDQVTRLRDLTAQVAQLPPERLADPHVRHMLAVAASHLRRAAHPAPVDAPQSAR